MIYSPQLDQILLPREMEPTGQPAYARDKEGLIIYGTDGNPLFRNIEKEGQKKYRIFKKNGELIPSFNEFKAKDEFKDQDPQVAQRAFMQMLAIELNTDERLGSYMNIMFNYQSDQQTLIRKTSSFSLPVTMVVNEILSENWQYWSETETRTDKDGYHLGDCEDYAFFLKEVLRLQIPKKQAFVLLIPRHATTIWVEKTEKGYEMRDCGTFSLLKVEGATIEECLRKILDRYGKSGLGVWAGQRLFLDKHQITVADVEKNYQGEKHLRESFLPLEALEDQEIASDFLYFQEILHRYLGLDEGEKTNAKKAQLKQEFERLKNKYKNKWYKFEKEKFPLVKLLESTMALIEGDKNKSIANFIQDYLENEGTPTQETLELLWFYLQNSCFKDKCLISFITELEKLPVLTYSVGLESLFRNNRDRISLHVLKNLVDKKCPAADRALYYRVILKQMSYQVNKEKELLAELGEVIFAQDDEVFLAGDKDDLIFLFENVSVEKRLAYALKALKVQPNEVFFQLEVMRALLQNGKVSMVDYLLEFSPKFDFLKNFENYDFATRSQIAYLKLKVLKESGKGEEVLEEIFNRTIKNLYPHAGVIENSRYFFASKEAVLEGLAQHSGKARGLLDKELTYQLDERDKGRLPEQGDEKGNRDLIPFDGFSYLLIEFYLSQSDFENLEKTGERIFQAKNVHPIVKYHYISFILQAMLEQKYEDKVKTGGAPFKHLLQFLQQNFESIHQQILINKDKNEGMNGGEVSYGESEENIIFIKAKLDKLISELEKKSR